MLKQHVTELVARHSTAADVDVFELTHHPMAPFELAREPSQDPLLVFPQHGRDDLGGKDFAFHARYRQQLAQLVVQALDALPDHRLDARGQHVPIQARPFDPTSGGIPHEVAALAQLVQQFQRKERVATSMFEQARPKPVVKPVRLAVQNGVDEAPAFAGLEVAELELEPAERARQLVDERAQRMRAGRLGAAGNVAGMQVAWPECPDDQQRLCPASAWPDETGG